MFPMKRSDLLLGVVLSLIAGLVGGFFLGQSFNEKGGGTVQEHSPSAPDAPLPPGSGPLAATPDRAGVNASSAFAKVQSSALATVFAEALHAESPFDQARLILLIDGLEKADFPRALELLKSAKSKVGRDSNVWIAFWERFGEADPEGALACGLAETKLGLAGGRNLEKHLFRGLARKDPAAAAAAYLAHPDFSDRQSVVEGLMVEWFAKNPPEATAWARQHLDETTMGRAYYAATWGLANGDDLSASVALLRNLAPDAPKASVIHGLSDQITRKPNLSAAQMLDTIAAFRSANVADLNLESQVAARAAKLDPMAAANFFAQPRPGSAAPDYFQLGEVSAIWFQKDARAAEAWAKDQEGTPHYAIVAHGFAAAAREANDEAAFQKWSAAAQGAVGSSPESAVGK